jgi:hypothetical protein
MFYKERFNLRKVSGFIPPVVMARPDDLKADCLRAGVRLLRALNQGLAITGSGVVWQPGAA